MEATAGTERKLSTAVAVLGLGEAGGAIAADLVAAGYRVWGFDPGVAEVKGTEIFGSAAEAVAERRWC